MQRHPKGKKARLATDVGANHETTSTQTQKNTRDWLIGVPKNQSNFSENMTCARSFFTPKNCRPRNIPAVVCFYAASMTLHRVVHFREDPARRECSIGAASFPGRGSTQASFFLRTLPLAIGGISGQGLGAGRLYPVPSRSHSGCGATHTRRGGGRHPGDGEVLSHM